MSIQHSQQIQHIRYAKQYTQFARRPASRRGSRGRRFGIAFTAIAAMVGFTGVAFSSSAHAQRPTEGASIPTTAVTQDTNTVTTPCFRGAGGPTVAYEAAASECTHTYGAPYDGFGIQGGGGGPSEGATEARIDGWMHHPVDNVSAYEQFSCRPRPTGGLTTSTSRCPVRPTSRPTAGLTTPIRSPRATRGELIEASSCELA